jgi:glycosyltransferase involved in cell wall biosynthesis
VKRDNREGRMVVMLGTAFESHGGIAAVLASWRSAGLFRRWPVEYVETHCQGSRMDKLACAAGALLAIASLALRSRAVLHVHCASRASFWRKSVFMALAQLVRWPVVLHLHGGGIERFYAQECGAARKAIVRHFLARADCVAVVSERWAAWVRSVAPEARVARIANPVACPSSVPLVRDGARIAFVAQCARGKGIFDLLEAIAQLRRDIPAVELACAGDGDLAAVRHRARELGIGANVRLTGWIDARQRDDLLAQSSVFVLPSHAEGVPVSLLEAMAAGCPVVATAVGGIPDVIGDGENGLLVAPGDPAALAAALRRLLVDRSLACRLAAAARETVRQGHGVQRSLEDLGRIYAGLGVRSGPARSRDSVPRLQEIS